MFISAPSSGHRDPIVLYIMDPSSVSNKTLYRSCFPPDVDKCIGYEKILESSGFGLLCKIEMNAHIYTALLKDVVLL